MTNVSLSVEDQVYKKMKFYSEIKWSEYIRKAIIKRINELDFLQTRKDKETILTMLASEAVLKKDWDNKADERWDHV